MTTRAMREWSWEVEKEMDRLIERGVPPFDAATQARDNVSRRRRLMAEEKDREEMKKRREAQK